MRYCLLVLLLVGCSNPSENEVVWQTQLDAAGAILAGERSVRGDFAWFDELAGDGAATRRRGGTGTPETEKQCPNGGTAKLYQDTLCFDNCEIPDSGGQIWDGGLTATDNEFSYDQYTITYPDGTVASVTGGYYTSGDTTTIDMTLSGQDLPEYGGDYTTHATGSVTVTSGTLNGSFTMQTEHQFEYGDADQATTCAFSGVDVSDWIRLIRDPDYKDLTVQRMCPQEWDEEISLKVIRRHRHSGDSDNIHILLPGETFPAGRLFPGSTNSELIPATVGDVISVSVGRGGVIWETIACPSAATFADLEAVYDDGFGLNSYEFYCIYKGEGPPVPTGRR